MLIDDLKKTIREVPDFPKPGINFYDVSTLFRNPEAFRATVDRMVERYRGERLDALAGIEARGFILGGAMARALDLGLVLLRKPGKLPSDTEGEDYELEYGTARLEIHKDAVSEGQRILIVDDQETILVFLRDRLEQLGFAIFTASNGAEALALIQKDSFQGILLDLEMPVMDGLSMLSQLRSQSNAVPVIVMSADPTRTTMIKAIEAGARDYLTKPISYEILKYKCLRLFA